MKATLIYNGELAAGIRPSSIEVTLDGVDLQDQIEVIERDGIRLILGDMGEGFTGGQPDSIILEDECSDCFAVGVTEDKCPNPNCIRNIEDCGRE